MFTYVFVFTYTIFWEFKDLHWVSILSIVICFIVFLIWGVFLIVLIAYQIMRKIWVKESKNNKNDFLFPDVRASNALICYLNFFIWRILISFIIIFGHYWNNFLIVMFFLIVQIFALKINIYFWPYKNGGKFTSLILTEFATISHGVTILICTETDIPYIGTYVIGYLCFIFVLLFYSI